jgi:N-acetylglucosamine-6-phosphate deacetylase
LSTTEIRGGIVTDYEVFDGGNLLLDGGRVAGVGREPGGEPNEVHEYPGCFVLPGFIDLQVNGSFGIDIASEPERLRDLSRALLARGTTSYLPTVISSPLSLYQSTLPSLAGGILSATPDRAQPLGVHLEGPFISMVRRGAHPARAVVPPDAGLLGELLDLAPVRMITLAPELDGAGEVIDLAASRGVVVSAGHSDADFDSVYRCFDRRVAGVTHLFNAMSRLHHREPGLPGAAFAHPRVVCGIIADGRHVHPEVVALAFRMLGPDRLCLTTDAISAAGMEEGEYPLATRRVYLDEEGVPRLAGGAIAGSVLTADEAFRNILAFTGCTVPEAARMASAAPARLVGEGDRKGRLVPGYDADITVLNPDLSVRAVYKAGALVYEAQGAAAPG